MNLPLDECLITTKDFAIVIDTTIQSMGCNRLLSTIFSFTNEYEVKNLGTINHTIPKDTQLRIRVGDLPGTWYLAIKEPLRPYLITFAIFEQQLECLNWRREKDKPLPALLGRFAEL